MAVIVEAVYENGVLKPAEPLPWKDGERDQVSAGARLMRHGRRWLDPLRPPAHQHVVMYQLGVSLGFAYVHCKPLTCPWS